MGGVVGRWGGRGWWGCRRPGRQARCVVGGVSGRWAGARQAGGGGRWWARKRGGGQGRAGVVPVNPSPTSSTLSHVAALPVGGIGME